MATPVEPIDPAKKNSEILGPTSDEATVQMDMQNDKCFWKENLSEWITSGASRN